MGEHIRGPVMSVTFIGSMAEGLRPAVVIVNSADEVIEVTHGVNDVPLAFTLGIEGEDAQVIIPTAVVRRLAMALDLEIKKASDRTDAMRVPA